MSVSTPPGNAFQWAAQSPSAEAVAVCRWLRARGLDVRVLNCNGHSAVHKAAIKGHRAVCEWLLSAEAGLPGMFASDNCELLVADLAWPVNNQAQPPLLPHNTSGVEQQMRIVTNW